MDNADAADQTVVWSIVGNTDSGTKIDAVTSGTATLTVSAKETARSLTVVAAHTDYTGVEYEGTLVVENTLAAITDTINAITPGSTDTVTVDGIEWYVLAKDTANSRALLLSQRILEKRPFGNNVSSWKNSTLRTYLNGEWLDKYHTVKTTAVEVTLYSQIGIYNAAVDTTQDKVFLLSQADVFGTWYNSTADQAVTDTRLYTYNGAPLALKDNGTLKEAVMLDGTNYSWWLRSPYINTNNIAAVSRDGGTINPINYNCGSSVGVRPAFWFDLSK